MEKSSLLRFYCLEKAKFKHLLRIMRVSLFLLFLCLHNIFADNVHSQGLKMAIDKNDVVLESVLNEIENRTDFLFIYSRASVNVGQKISVKTEGNSIKELLDKVFERTGITYKVVGTHIILSSKEEAEVAGVQQAKIRITGKVKDEANEPVPGASVQVKGATTGTITDGNGAYSIAVPDKNAILVYSFLGYAEVEKSVGNHTVIDVTLKEDSRLIDEVIVVGYGSTSKRKMVSSISSIPMEDIEALPASSIVENLGGRTPGIIVSGNGGGPNNYSSISIRGGKTPIVVIDGVVSDYANFQNINPSDIENLRVLKDASAAAIYGSRAGNGILLVTTKRGAQKPLSIQYDFTYSMSQPTVLPKKNNSFERASYINEGYKNDNLAAVYSPEILEKYRTGSDPYNYPDVDWQALCLDNFAPESRHNLSLNGGDQRNNYYASLSYYDQGSLYVFDTNEMKRYNIRLNMTNTFEKIGLKTTTGLSGNFYDYNAPWADYYLIWGHIQNKGPWDLAYNDKGGYYSVSDHPLVEMDPRSGYNKQSRKNMSGMFKAEWSVPSVSGLKLTSLSNYEYNAYKRKAWRDLAPQYGLGTTVPAVKNPPRLEEEFLQGNSFTQQFLVDYERKINDFTVSALIGYEFTKSANSNLKATRENYQLNVDQIIAGPTANMTNDGREYEYGRAGYVGRLKLDYKAKYLLDASFRRDGSDWFPKNKRWGTFYAFSGGWVVSDEKFMKELKNRNILNVLKLRGSYGVVGLDGSLTEGLDDNDPFKLKRFSYVPGYNLDERAYVMNNAYVQGFHEGELVSSDITWYTTSSLDLGFDFESLGNRLSGGFDYFYTRTTGYLTSPSNVGYTDPLGIALPRIKSDGAERKQGFEVYMGYKDQIGDFSYGVNVNFTYYNKLWENNPTENEDKLKNPRKRNTHVFPYNREGYKAIGYYTSEEDIANSPRPLNSVNLRPGDIKYQDIDGNGIIDDADKVRIGYSGEPQSTYGINVDLGYKGAFLSALFQGSGKRHFYQGDGLQARNDIIYPFQTDYWTPENTNSKYPRLASSPSFNGNNNYLESDFWLIDASYFRLKSLQVGYDFKYKLLKNVNFLSTAKITLSGTNLFTISNAMDYFYDPESGGQGNNYNYPYQRVYSVTLNLGF